jgi:hypothetical protein
VEAGSLEVRNGAQIRAVVTSSSSGRGGNLSVDAGSIFLSGDGATGFTGIAASANRRSSGDAGNLTVRAGSLEVREGAQVSASTFGSGDGGELLVEAGSILLSGNGASGFPSGIFSNAGEGGSGDARDLTVRAGSLEVRNDAEISAGTFGSGQGGNLLVEAGSILLSGDEAVGFTGIAASANRGSTGDAGNLTVRVGNLEVWEGARISADTFGPGRGGNLTIDAHDVLVDGFGVLGEGENQSTQLSQISASSAESAFKDAREDSARAGDLSITTDRLKVSNGGQVLAATFGPGQGGNLKVNAKDVVLQGTGGGFPSGLFVTAEPGSSGDGGDLALTTNTLQVLGGAFIAAGTSGPGRGGNVTVNAADIELRDGGSLSASSEGSGLAGDIFIDVGESFQSFNSSVSTEARFSDGGNITLNAGNLVFLQDSAITASVGEGGDGGNINIDPTFVVLDNSRIVANAVRGRGGNIQIVSDFFFKSPDSEVSASSKEGIQGTVEIDSPDTDISGSITVLPSGFLNVAALLGERCATRLSRNASSFVVGSLRGVPPGPDERLIGSYVLDLPGRAGDGQAAGIGRAHPGGQRGEEILTFSPVTIGCLP